MNSSNLQRVGVSLLCALLFWLAAHPPHCDLCDGLSLTAVPNQMAHLRPAHAIDPDDCNGICSCCGFQAVPAVKHALISLNAELAAVVPGAPRPRLGARSTIFHPPRIAFS
jgi:hypothetical protein